jgi:ring-1,2-phenylacetyl-CoA epoxidase subunit PaaE
MSSNAPRFHRLAVNDLRRESADAVSLTFSIPPELADNYSFAPGQYLTLRTTMDGEEIRRSYSICSGPDDGELRIAVKKVDGASALHTRRIRRGSMSALPRAPASRRSCRL